MQTLVGTSILLPVAVALACLALPSARLRGRLVVAYAVVMAALSLAIFQGGPFAFTPGDLAPVAWDTVITVLDFALLAVVGFVALRLRSWLSVVFIALQLAGLAWFEGALLEAHNSAPVLIGDSLSLVMALVVNIVGGLVLIHAVPYMRQHEHHQHLAKSRQGRFFFFMTLFLGAMNGLIFANDLLWLYFFWEVTTVCSFALIAHDRTPEALANASRALWMNMLGGAAFLAGIIITYGDAGSLSLQVLLFGPYLSTPLLVGVALLCLAAMTKSALAPFQSWLAGAMVAPGPVSALLHSSTMVKAGVYLLLRLAPAFAGTFVADAVSWIGAFSFLGLGIMAVSQSDTKRILAYSTILNLGLIAACAGVGTVSAVAAAVLLIVFHAISKALLFMGVATAEQAQGSRDLEDLRGLWPKMPVTSLCMLVGILSMLLPPFGVILGKWLAVEAMTANLPALAMVSVGAAFHVVIWGRWAGNLLSSAEFGIFFKPRKRPWATRLPLLSLSGAALLLSLGAVFLYPIIVGPVLDALHVEGLRVGHGVVATEAGSFSIRALFAVMAAAIALGLWVALRLGPSHTRRPYLCGVQATEHGELRFAGPMHQLVRPEASNIYLSERLGEGALAPWLDALAAGLVVVMFLGAALGL